MVQYEKFINLLERMIATPSFSVEEGEVADMVVGFLGEHGICAHRHGNNIIAYNRYFSSDKPTILLNSHIDTVKPNTHYTRDPFKPEIVDGKLYGLGSNDAGASVVSLIAAFIHFYNTKNLAYNLCLGITAEEEISGRGGMESMAAVLEPISFAIVGEPTGMNMAVCERGLMVLDCVAHGIPGHAARREGVNAICEAIKDIEWFHTYKFPKESKYFGNVDMNVTVISAGQQHNVVPGECHFTVDVRVTDCYTNQEVLDIIKEHVACDVAARSLRLTSSFIDENHPIVQAGRRMGMTSYASPTTSDQALLNVPSLKLGPGESSRSHSADEFIMVDEITHGIDRYIEILETLEL